MNKPNSAGKVALPFTIAAMFVVLILASPAIAQIPLLTQPLIPASTVPGSTAFTLTVNGSGFVSGAVIEWNGSPRTTTFHSHAQVSAAILASDVSSPGTASVTVVNPGDPPSNSVYFPVTDPISPWIASQVNYPFGDSEFFSPALVIGDFNHDGKLDFAGTSANYSIPGSLSVFLGNGNGSFQSPAVYALGIYGTSLVAADFNSDGNLDLAVTNDSDGTFYVLLGNGDGTFQPQIVYTVGAPAVGLAAADFNGDGKMDLAVTANNFSILLGNGDGTFQSPIVMSATYVPYRMTVGDFNGDGKLDIAATNGDPSHNNVISVLLGNGDGTLQSPLSSTLPYFTPVDLKVADFNGDGKLDLAVSGVFLAVLIGNGDGTFQPGTDYGGEFALYGGLAFGDFNGDGKLDIAGAGERSAGVFFGNGDGTFQDPVTSGSLFQGDWADYGDFNNDGKLDLMVTDNINTADLMMQGTFTFVPGTQFRPHRVAMKVPVGSSQSQTVTFSNPGNAPLTGVFAYIGGESRTAFAETNNCPTNLYPGASCSMTVTFAPAKKFRYTAKLFVQDNATGTPQWIPLIGEGK